MISSERARRRSPGSLRTAVLAALVEQPAHGYDLTTRLNRRLGPVHNVDARRVYEVLEQLEKDGLATCSEEHAAFAPHRARRVFSATKLGRELHAGWLAERQLPPLARADIHVLVAFSGPEQAEQLLTALDEYEIDCIEMLERGEQIEVQRASWRSRMIGLGKAAVAEQLQAELRWVTRVRREIDEYRALRP
jgi:DNA-binding PadR family transcriptional regulator